MTAVETPEAASPAVTVVREPLTYEREAPRSYFRDLALSRAANVSAEKRLKQHAKEMRVELPALEKRNRARAAESGLEFRVNPSTTDGQGGYFSPPLWMIDRFATAVRPGRVLSHLIPTFPLPPGVSSVNLPRLTTGTQALPSSPLGNIQDRDIVDAVTSSPVVTISGRGDVALQVLEQSPTGAHLDWAIFRDLTESYDHQLEAQILAGTGAGAQFTGLLNLPTGAGGVNVVTYTDASPTGSEMFAYLGQLAAQVGNNRLRPPEAWVMRTSRWGWLGSAEDTAGQPLAVPGHVPNPPLPHLLDDDIPTPVGMELGWPIYCSDAIPANLGTGANQDTILAVRPSDMFVLESTPQAAVMLDPLSGTLQARLSLHAYAAAIVGRYPTGIATLQGTGMAVQTGF